MQSFRISSSSLENGLTEPLASALYSMALANPEPDQTSRSQAEYSRARLIRLVQLLGKDSMGRLRPGAWWRFGPTATNVGP